MAHYWVLRQQAPSPLVGVGVLCLGSRRPAGGRVPFVGGAATSVQGVRVVV